MYQLVYIAGLDQSQSLFLNTNFTNSWWALLTVLSLVKAQPNICVKSEPKKLWPKK